MSISTIQQPLSALFQQADQKREILELAQQKVEFATAQNAFGNGVPMFDTMTEALSAIGIAALIAAAAAAVGGYFLYRWMKHRRATDKIASTTWHFFFASSIALFRQVKFWEKASQGSKKQSLGISHVSSNISVWFCPTIVKIELILIPYSTRW